MCTTTISGKEDTMRQSYKGYWRKCCLLFVLLFIVGGFCFSSRSEASSCVIQFTSAATEIKRGDIFTIVCQVSSSDPFLDTSFMIDYDDSIMQFIKGGKKVSGGYGELLVESSGNTTETYKKTFSLQFMGKGNGSGLISVKGTAEVTDAEGNAFSVSSNRLSIHVRKKSAGVQAESTQAVVTPSPEKSGKNRLKSLRTTALSMSPGFAADITEYRATVDCNTDTLYISFRPEDEKAGVRILGNEKLKQGDNQVSIQVTAENGNVREYRIIVNRETPEETQKRVGTKEKEEKQNDVEFAVSQRGDTILLQNSYEFEVLDADELSTVPEGYIQTRITLEGVSISAFTMEDELDSNYLLLYLKGPSGENGLYQYDREEKTLQRYTGSMVERINNGRASGGSGGLSGESLPNYVMLAIIVILVIVILCLLIAMLKMAIRKKEPDKDMLDF